MLTLSPNFRCLNSGTLGFTAGSLSELSPEFFRSSSVMPDYLNVLFLFCYRFLNMVKFNIIKFKFIAIITYQVAVRL